MEKTYFKTTFNNHQIFDYEGLEGRLLSTSFIPLNDHPNYNDMLFELKKLFEKFQKNDQIRFEYEAEVYYGQLL